MSSQRYDLAIVGGGIAGLAISEIFARSGRSVILLERDAHLCQGTSASQHGWFHFGSLYSIFPQNQYLRTMVGGVEDLLNYYAMFPGMNITVADCGRLAFPQTAGAWFRDEPIEYIVSARNDPDFDMLRFHGLRDYARKVFFLATWEIAIKQFVSRHQRFYRHNWHGPVAASQWIPRAGWADYSRQVITKPNQPGVNLDVDTHFRIVGYDRPMVSTTIITDLVRSLIGAGGEIVSGTEVECLEKIGAGSTLYTSCGKAITANTVIVSAGQWLGRFLGPSTVLKVLASPLVVAYPAVADSNFVRMTPFVEKSVNHLHHQIDGNVYSLIGGGYFANPDDVAGVARAREKLKDMAIRVFPKLGDAQVLETYLGYKTEMVAKAGERNYQYFIRKIDDGVYAVIPGKFSLAFSLAVNVFKSLTGDVPALQISMAEPDNTRAFVGLTRHALLVRRGLGNQYLV